MRAEGLLTYMELADPMYVEEASDRNVMLYRKRRKRMAWVACACLAVVLLAGVLFAEPAMNAWNMRNTVVSWPSPALPGASVKPSSGVYVSAELPTRRKMDADQPFTLSVGLGQATDYEYATLTIDAPGFEIIDKDGNAAKDHYVRTLSEFNSDSYGVLYNNRHNVTGCVYLEDFTFRYLGGDGEGSVSISLLSRDESGSAGDSVSLYYTVANGALKMTDKRPADNQGNGVTLEEETAEGEVSLSKEDISVQVHMDSWVLTPGQYFGNSVKITARHKTYLTEYSTDKFTAELVYAETLREKDYSFFIKKPTEQTEEGAYLSLVPRVPIDTPIGTYDLRVTDLETGFVWVFENMAWVLPPDITAYEDFVCEATTTSPYLTRGEAWMDKIRIRLSEGERDLPPEYEDSISIFHPVFMSAYLQYDGQEAYKIRLIEPAHSSFLPSGRIPDDAPFGSYTLVVVFSEYGYAWTFENFVEVIATSEPA